MKLEYIKIQNFRSLHDVEVKMLPKLCVFLGANGAGKSTFFDVFSFLRDCLLDNVRVALQKRGGFTEVRTRGCSGAISIELKFRDDENGPLITYQLEIDQGDKGPFVKKERLQYRRGKRGQPWRFLDFQNGAGTAITNEEEYSLPDAAIRVDNQKLESNDILAIKGLGQFEKFKAASAFRRLIENWHISNLHIVESRESVEVGYSEHLSTSGANLAIVAQYIYKAHPDRFARILKSMKQRIPGIEKVEAVETVDGRVVLSFQDGAFHDPFIGRYVSDGTLKMFAYLILLNDPSPHPLLAVEEPENQLHPDLMAELVEEFRAYSLRGGQVFVSTHSPDFVRGVQLDELFWLTKLEGRSKIVRASDDPNLKSLLEKGDDLGTLWRQRVFKGGGPFYSEDLRLHG